MGWDNGPPTWKQLQQALTWGKHGELEEELPARPHIPKTLVDPDSVVPYAELHCHSAYSFLDGVSELSELADQAAGLGLSALALTDHDGFYGVVRFAQAAAQADLRTVFGAELSLGLDRRQTGAPDPAGEHLLMLARGQEGYHRLSGVLSAAHGEGKEKGRPVYDLSEVARKLDGHAMVLTGCRKGTVPKALLAGGVREAARELDRLKDLFGAERVVVELIDHADPLDGERNVVLAELAEKAKLPVVATNNVHFHHPSKRKMADIVAAIRARSSLDDIDPYLSARPAYLRSGAEMAALFSWHPDAVAYTVEVADQCAFNLGLIAPELPVFEQAGYTLRELTYEGAQRRWGPRHSLPDVYRQLDHELDMIERLGFPGYFLIVHDIVKACRDRGIYCQGRGSAANSAVCYALSITNVDSIKFHLLFERFLAPERDGYPDIDVDIESARREEIIQYVYGKYGRTHSAQVANVISYRPRSAVRDVARAFGFSPGQQDAWSKQLDRWNDITGENAEGIPDHVAHYAKQLLGMPRHLGIHSGGMVIAGNRPLTEVCPVEWAAMENRTVLQWDKDDCAEIKLIKFDLLGLGMLSALRYAFEFIDSTLDLGNLPVEDDEVYEMLCQADTVGVFQVESRAQMSTLPRLRPREFYDLVVEVALIRPGPIQGGAVHPYIARRNGKEPVTYAHSSLQNALRKTLGVVLFQEQCMQIAIDVAGFTAVESDQLRRAMSAKRSVEKMDELREKFMTGAISKEVPPEIAADIFAKLMAFANYGFPESHSMSFAYLVYASAWVKRYHPAAFCAALLAAQPMGFYSPQSLCDDARRHGVQVRRPCINSSLVKATIESTADTRYASMPKEPPSQWGMGGPAVRLGLDQIRGLGTDATARIIAARESGEFTSMADVARRCQLSVAHLEALATADAFACFDLDRRSALWAAGAAAREAVANTLPHTSTGLQAPVLPGMDDVDKLVSDVWATGLSPDSHPIRLVRTELDEQGAVPIKMLPEVADRSRVLVGGLVTHRQRPATAGGVTFLSLEDETGMLNVVCSQGLWSRYRKVARTSSALLIRGTLESASGVINLVADKLTVLPVSIRPKSRDFR